MHSTSAKVTRSGSDANTSASAKKRKKVVHAHNSRASDAIDYVLIGLRIIEGVSLTVALITISLERCRDGGTIVKLRFVPGSTIHSQFPQRQRSSPSCIACQNRKKNLSVQAWSCLLNSSTRSGSYVSASVSHPPVHSGYDHSLQFVFLLFHDL